MTGGSYGSAKLNFDDLQNEQKYSPWRVYMQSKLAAVLFMRELDRRAREASLDLISVAAHPGLAKTNLQYSGPTLGGKSMKTAGARLTRGPLPARGAGSAELAVRRDVTRRDGRQPLPAGRLPPCPGPPDAGRDQEARARRGRREAAVGASEQLTGVEFALGEQAAAAA